MIAAAGFVLFLLALPLVAGPALWRGDRSSRQAAIALIAGVAGTQIAGALGHLYQAPELGIMAVDAALFLAFAVVAYRSERFWPIWISAAQLVGTVTHLVMALHPTVNQQTYVLLQQFWVYPILAGIAWGTWVPPAPVRWTSAPR
jgi:hypothetical protein